MYAQCLIFFSSQFLVLNFRRSDATVVIHFFHMDDEDERIKYLMQQKLRYGRLGRYAVNKTYMELIKEPGSLIYSLLLKKYSWLTFKNCIYSSEYIEHRNKWVDAYKRK